MKINYYTRVYNEERLIPYVFRHYDNIVDQYFIWDHNSIDKTKELLLQNPKVTVLECNDPVDEEIFRQFKCRAWKPYINGCDWAIIADFDEFLYHTDILNLLASYKEQGITVVRTKGFQMFSESFPTENKQIYEVITTGLREPLYDKSIIINPEIEPNYSYGAHYIDPIGNVKYSLPEIKLLHYKVIGKEYIDFVLNRNERLSERDKSLGLTLYSLRSDDPFNPVVIYENLKHNSIEVI